MTFVRTKEAFRVNLGNSNITVTGKDYTPELNQIIETLGNLQVTITEIEGLPSGDVDLTPVVEELSKVNAQIVEHSSIAQQLSRNTNQNLAQLSNLAAGIGQSVEGVSTLISEIKEQELSSLTEGQLASLNKLSEILAAIKAEREFFQSEFDQTQELQKEGNTLLANVSEKLTPKKVKYVRKEVTINLNEAPLRVEVPDDYSAMEYSVVWSKQPETEERRLDYTVAIDGDILEYCNDAQFEQPLLSSNGKTIPVYGKTILNFPNPQDKEIKVTVLFLPEYVKPIQVTMERQEEEDLLTPPLDMEPNAPQF